MVIDDKDNPDIPWTSVNQVISLGAPCGSAFTSMTVALSVVIEYIYYTEEQIELNVGRLSASNDQSLSIA